MATVPYVVDLYDGGNLFVLRWPTMNNGDVGQAYPRGILVDRSMQIEGTFGAAGQIVIEGSNDGVNFHTLTDPFSNLLTITAAGLKQITEITSFLRPRVTGGDGTTQLTCTAALHRTFPTFAV